jgi:hypothetical protein
VSPNLIIGNSPDLAALVPEISSHANEDVYSIDATPDHEILPRTLSYDDVAKVQSFKRTPSNLFESFLDETLFADSP